MSAQEEWEKMRAWIAEAERNKKIDEAQRMFRDSTNGRSNDGGSNGNGKRKTIVEIRDEFYNKLKAKFTFKTIRDSQEIIWFESESGVYRFDGEVKIKEELGNLFQEALQNGEVDKSNLLTEHDRNEIVKRIQWDKIIDRRDFEDHNEYVINVKNGLLNINTKQILPHSSDFISVKQFPVVYDPNAKWTEVLKFFKQVQNREGVTTLIKMFGYILMTYTVKYQKAFFFAGRGDNGKSVVIDLIEAFIGEDNCSSVKLHDLRNDRFMAAKMYGMIANTYADIPATNLQDVGLFKALVSGDRITAQHKYGKLFDFRNRAKLVFSGNTIPLSEGEDDLAYFKRWVILRFEALFKGSKQDKELIKKLITPQNLSGSLNLALVGIKLLERDGFENIPIEVIREEYDRQSLSHTTFVESKCTVNLMKMNDYFIAKDNYYSTYLNHCKEMEIEPLTLDQVEIELSKYKVFDGGATRKRKMIDGIKKECFFGIITHEEANRRNQEILERQKQNTL